MGWTHRISTALVALTLVGCGTASTTTGVKAPSRSLGAVSNPTPMPMTPAAAPSGPAAQVGAQMLQLLRAKYASATGVDADIKSYSQGHYKMGEYVSDLRQATTEAKMTWAKPNKLHMSVVTTSNPLLEGAALATPDGQEITARAAGLLSIFPFHFSPTDAKLRNNRNHAFTQNNPKTQIERITSASAVWTAVADSTVEGTPVKMMTVDNVARLDKEITREVVAIDPAAGTLRALVMYAGNTRVLDYHFMSFKWNPKVSDDMFTL